MRVDRARGEAAALVLVVFILGALVGGLGNHLWGARVWGARVSTATHQQQTSPKAQIISQLNHEVNLTPDEEKQLGGIIDETQGKLKNLYANTDAQREKIRLGSHVEIRAILTPEQQAKYDDFVLRIEAERKKNAAAN